MHNIAILNYVLFPFNGNFPYFATSCFRAKFHIVVVLDYFGPDESFLKIAMNNSGSFWGFNSFSMSRHGFHLHLL